MLQTNAVPITKPGIGNKLQAHLATQLRTNSASVIAGRPEQKIPGEIVNHRRNDIIARQRRKREDGERPFTANSRRGRGEKTQSTNMRIYIAPMNLNSSRFTCGTFMLLGRPPDDPEWSRVFLFLASFINGPTLLKSINSVARLTLLSEFDRDSSKE